MGVTRRALLFIGIAILIGVSIYSPYVPKRFNWSNIHIIEQREEVTHPNKEINAIKYHHRKRKANVKQNISQMAAFCRNCTVSYQSEKNFIISKNVTNSNPASRKRQIWISMGLCFSKNTDMYGKRYYPYALVTPLAITLWYYFFPTIRVIIYLIYDQHELEDRRKLYEEQLKQTNVEIRWVRSDDMSCMTKSQIPL